MKGEKHMQKLIWIIGKNRQKILAAFFNIRTPTSFYKRVNLLVLERFDRMTIVVFNSSVMSSYGNLAPILENNTESHKEFNLHMDISKKLKKLLVLKRTKVDKLEVTLKDVEIHVREHSSLTINATRRLLKKILMFFLKGKYLKKDGISTKQGDFPAEGKNIWETFCEIKTRSNENRRAFEIKQIHNLPCKLKIPKGTMEYTTFLLRKLIDFIKTHYMHLIVEKEFMTENRLGTVIYVRREKEQVLLTYSALLVIEDFIKFTIKKLHIEIIYRKYITKKISCLFSICPVYVSVEHANSIKWPKNNELFKIVRNAINIYSLSSINSYNDITCVSGLIMISDIFLSSIMTIYSLDIIRDCTFHDHKLATMFKAEKKKGLYLILIKKKNGQMDRGINRDSGLLPVKRIMINCIKLGSQLSLKKQVNFCEIGKYSMVDHINMNCNRMLGLNYMKKHNEVTNKIRSYSVQEVMSDDNAEIRVDTRISTDIKINNNKPDINVLYKKNKKFLIVEKKPSLEEYIQSLMLKKTLENDAGEKELGKTMDPNNNNCGEILDPKDLTKVNKDEIKKSHITSYVPKYEAS
ncbi:hypothetical protein NAPIS_ORF01553 [Vairimorpha apis BRL 01]|uniref:Uncharacterized protein n=1 Tax=Vairimorpha apis BRL 01 TaxID=1037528 RepID=T0MCI3_9MICR|nr:hypothetical protein NAPIS_ORF01553 [Vairimorpha apis BRL 01]